MWCGVLWWVCRMEFVVWILWVEVGGGFQVLIPPRAFTPASKRGTFINQAIKP